MHGKRNISNKFTGGFAVRLLLCYYMKHTDIYSEQYNRIVLCPC